MTDDTDRALVRRIREGDRQAWDRFFERFHGRLLSAARSRTRNEERAEDIASTVWLKVVRGLCELHDTDAAPGWIWKVFQTTLVDSEGRDRSRREEVQVEASGDAVIAWAPDPDARILVEELLRAANPRERQVLQMYLAGDATAEIARALGLDESTVRHRITSMRQWGDRHRDARGRGRAP